MIVCRPARPSDVPALSTVARRTWSDAFGSTVSAEDEAAELESTRSEAYFETALTSDTILVAEDDGVLVGYVQFGDVEIPEVQPHPEDRELRRLYVESELQGQGAGRMLLNAALGHPRLVDAHRIFLEQNERAIRLYEAAGFRRVGTTAFTIGSGERVEDVVMMLDRETPR